MIHLLLADDHEKFRHTLHELLDEEPDLEVVAEAENGRQAISLARELSPEVVLMDVEMPVIDGIRATREITSDLPHTAVIGLSVYHDQHLIGAMLDAGAAGYLPKDEDLPVLIRVIRAIASRSTPLTGRASASRRTAPETSTCGSSTSRATGSAS